jgi:hypothetical protein
MFSFNMLPDPLRTFSPAPSIRAHPRSARVSAAQRAGTSISPPESFAARDCGVPAHLVDRLQATGSRSEPPDAPEIEQIAARENPHARVDGTQRFQLLVLTLLKPPRARGWHIEALERQLLGSQPRRAQPALAAGASPCYRTFLS